MGNPAKAMSQGPVPATYGYPGYGAGMSAPYGGPPGATYYGSQQVDGKVVDRYMTMGETKQYQEPYQVMTYQTVNEQQVTYEAKEVTVKVPRTVMEDVEVTYQVPAYETRTHTVQKPKTVMEEQVITEQVPRTVMQARTVQVPQTQTYNTYQMVPKIVEYERPKVMPGRYVRTYDGPAQAMGYAQTTYAAPTGVIQGSAPAPAVTMGSAPAPVMTTMQQPIMYGGYPGTYGGYPGAYPGTYGYPTVSPTTTPIGQADDAISA